MCNGAWDDGLLLSGLFLLSDGSGCGCDCGDFLGPLMLNGFVGCLLLFVLLLMTDDFVVVVVVCSTLFPTGRR